MFGIFYEILSVPQKIVMDLNNVMFGGEVAPLLDAIKFFICPEK